TKEQFRETLLNIFSIYKSHIETNLAGKKDTDTHRVINFSEMQTFAFQIPETIPKLDRKILLKNFDKENLVSAKKNEIDEIKELLAKFESSTTQLEETAKEDIIEEVTPSEKSVPELREDITELDVEIAPDRSYAEGGGDITENELQIDEESLNQTTNEITPEESPLVSEVASEIDLNMNVLSEESLSVSTSLNAERTPEEEALAPQQLNDYASNSYPSLNQLIDEQKRKQFIEELFYSMEENYDILVRKIDEAQNLEEALKQVEAFYNEYGIFTEMPIAKEFIELVNRRFTAQTK
ncbi:MAG: hypothetical protein ACK4SO_05750, partial [Candidatus Kapaibacteriota bacterium]